MFRYYKDEKMISWCRGESVEFNITLPIKDENGYVKYSDGTNIYWYNPSNKKVYDAEYKKTSISVDALEVQLMTYTDGDVIRFKVFEKDDYNQVLIQKDFVAIEDDTRVKISLTSEETTIGEMINDYIDYCYEIELNPETNSKTIVGFDDDGEKIFRMFPEGGLKK